MPGHVYKRGEIYWIKFSYRGKAYYTSAKTAKKGDAQRLLSRYLGEVAAGTFQGFHGNTVPMREVFDDFVETCCQRKLRSLETVIHHLKPVRKWFEKRDADQITERDIDLYIKSRLALGRSTTTVNRELQYLGQSMRLAKRKKLIKDIPLIEKFPEDNARQGFFERDDFERVVSFLPEDLKDFARFAYHAGWRRNEVAKLEWTHIEGDVLRLPPAISKTKDGRVLILVGELATVIERRRALRSADTPRVFHQTLQGSRYVRSGGSHPIKTFYKAWKTACRKAGVPVKRLFHDFRHTTVRNMNRAGMPRQIAKKISGHKTDSIFNRYDIVDEDDIREGLMKTQRYFQDSGDNPVT